MATLIFNDSERREISEALQMNMCFLETGSFRSRRNDAIDSRNYSCIRKTTLDEDRLLVDLADIKNAIERVSPGRNLAIDDKHVPVILGAVRMRIAFTETGTSLRRSQVEKYNRAIGEGSGVRHRPLLLLTSTQKDLLEKMLDIESRLSDIGFFDDTQPRQTRINAPKITQNRGP